MGPHVPYLLRCRGAHFHSMTTDDTILEAMRRAGRELRASELSVMLGYVKTSTVLQRLTDLHARGQVARRPTPRVRDGLWSWSRPTRAILADHPPE